MAQSITTDKLEKLINAAIQTLIDQEVRLAVEDAHRRIDNKIPDIIAGVSLRVLKQFSVAHLNDEMVIHVRIEKR